MPVISVLYLPRDDRLRMIVRIAIDFVEEVYRDEILSDLRLISFDYSDSLDMDHAKYIATREGFTSVVEHRGCKLEPRLPLFSWPHYNHNKKYAWIPVFRYLKISEIFYNVAHEVSHHVVGRLPREGRSTIIDALRSDLGVDVEDALIKYMRYTTISGKVPKWVTYLHATIDEITTIYISYNYFATLEREPRTPTHLTGIKDFAEPRYIIAPLYPPMPIYRVLEKLYYKLARQDLANFRRVVHEVFVKTIKRFPIDVLESNRAKYGILYSEERVYRAP
jgi:hypothetical protein